MSGCLWKFSDQLDDADRIMIQKDFITLSEGAEYYGLGMKQFTRIAREAGAVYKIGKMVRIRRSILEKYLRNLIKGSNHKYLARDKVNLKSVNKTGQFLE